MPEELLRYTGATWAVLGDGETVFPLLLAELSQGRTPEGLPGVAWVESGVFNSTAVAALGKSCPVYLPEPSGDWARAKTSGACW